ncbi:MAG: hypothetical protein HY822_02130 [Acidobacteria bacterium]|nr:hypothetical protein [Acidobacteriota bacterium]
MIHFRNRTLWAAAAAAVVAGAGLWFWQSRRHLSVAELADHLPPTEAVVLHIDVAALRRAGVLDLIAGSRAAEESDYKSFVTQSGFNYREDLDTVVASFHSGQTSLLLGGRFDWKALEAYAARQGGGCENGFCRMPASTPNRHISFFALRPNVMALASGPDAWGAAAMRSPTRTRPAVRVTSKPVWLFVPGAAFKSAGGLPPGTRLFAKALEDAENALVWVGLDGVRLQVQIEATCKTEEGAVILRAQMEKVTDVLRKLILRSGVEANQRDLSGVLTQGTFQRKGRVMIGRWPLERAFLESLAGGS